MAEGLKRYLEGEGFDDVATCALKRGRGGLGVPVEISNSKTGLVFRLIPEDRATIARVIDESPSLEVATDSLGQVLAHRQADPMSWVTEDRP